MTETISLAFSAHARIKDIVGRGLIISDNIAIIELIKNSKDAGSSSVEIEFAQSKENPLKTELRISDHGIGMSKDDIEFKWLNIAYSEKKNTKPLQGAYAGNKGIGRFSCDRLGSKLTIYTRKLHQPVYRLDINWTDFEVDDRLIDIGKIKNSFSELSESDFETETNEPVFLSGTKLIISELRQDWDLEHTKSLRKELERFIIDPDNSFNIHFSHWKFSKDSFINSPIENKIFEELDFRATSIIAETISNGEQIRFELRHDGEFVFRSIEKNPYRDIKQAKLNLMFLNQPAKAFFKKRTGYRSVDFGSVFLFLNGFRVFPYGSAGDDWLGIQRRHAQGQKRFFGTRDLVGFIQITDSDEKFIPVSSREGLVRNSAFQQLTALEKNIISSIDEKEHYSLFQKAMRKLEKFVVDGLDWDRIDRTIGEDNDEELLSGNYEFLKGSKPVLETIDSIIKIRSPENHIVGVDINVRYLSELAQQGTQEYDDLIENLEQKFDGTPIDKLQPSEKRDLSKFISRQAKELASKIETNLSLLSNQKEIKKELETEKRRRMFSDFEATSDQTRIIQLHHQISLVAGALIKRMDRVVRKYRDSPSSFSKDDLITIIESGIFQTEKIQNVAKLASKADFDLSTNKVNTNILQFIEEYLEQFRDVAHGWGIKVNYINPLNIKLVRTFRPIEITLLVDNLIDNAGKANAKVVDVSVDKNDSTVIIDFIDNGKGITDRFDSSQLFHKGISTTSGSGIGLSHAKQIVEDLSGTIEISNLESKQGTKVRIRL